MNSKRFSDELKKVFEYIKTTLLDEYDTDDISPLYFLLSVLEQKECDGYKLLAKNTKEEKINDLIFVIRNNLSLNARTFNRKKRYNEVFESVFEEINKDFIKKRSKLITSDLVLVKLITKNKDLWTIIAQNLEITQLNYTELTEGTVNNALISKTNTKKTVNKTKYVDNSPLINLTNEINEVNYQEFIDTECYFDRIFTILLKKECNNVLIYGNKCCGKTLLVKNIAYILKYKTKMLPNELYETEIYELNFDKLFDGITLFTQVYQKMLELEKKIRELKYPIIFIDNFDSKISETIYAESGFKLINNLLTNKNIQVIYTISEGYFHNTTKKKHKLNEHSEFIKVKDLDDETIVKILPNLSEKYCLYHNISLDTELYKPLINLCKRYFKNSSILLTICSILDTIGAQTNLNNSQNVDTNYLELENKIVELNQKIKTEKENSKFDEVDNLEKELNEVKHELSEIKKKKSISSKPKIINVNDIKNAISSKLNIPISELSLNDKEKLAHLNDNIKKKVIGQDEAVDVLCGAIKRQRIGISNPNKPPVFLLMGTTGVGKTYLAKTIAKEMFNDENKLIRLDMSEFSDKSSVTNIFGAPPSYVGYEDSNSLADKLRVNNRCVLLLDEIEKAHSTIFNSFLQLFDEGRITNKRGVTIDCRDIIVIMTSNIGANTINHKRIGFSNEETDITHKNKILSCLNKHFSPEFINRIDKTVCFNPLTNEVLFDIIKLEVTKIVERVNNIGYKFSVADDSELYNIVLKQVVEQKNMGARPILRVLQTELEDKITKYIIENEIDKDKIITYEDVVAS